jgi:hypothetical protein
MRDNRNEPNQEPEKYYYEDGFFFRGTGEDASLSIKAVVSILNAPATSSDEQANLGIATTGELLAELKARAEIDGSIGYRTVDADNGENS